MSKWIYFITSVAFVFFLSSSAWAVMPAPAPQSGPDVSSEGPTQGSPGASGGSTNGPSSGNGHDKPSSPSQPSAPGAGSSPNVDTSAPNKPAPSGGGGQKPSGGGAQKPSGGGNQASSGGGGQSQNTGETREERRERHERQREDDDNDRNGGGFPKHDPSKSPKEKERSDSDEQRNQGGNNQSEADSKEPRDESDSDQRRDEKRQQRQNDNDDGDSEQRRAEEKARRDQRKADRKARANQPRRRFPVLEGGEFKRMTPDEALESGALIPVDSADEVREDLKRQGRRFAFVVDARTRTLEKIYADKSNEPADGDTSVLSAWPGRAKYIIVGPKAKVPTGKKPKSSAPKEKGAPEKFEGKDVIDVSNMENPPKEYDAGLRYYFDTLEDGVEFFTQPNAMGPDLLKRKNHKVYIQNLTTGEIYELDLKNQTLKKVLPDQMEPGSNIDGVFEEEPRDLLSSIDKMRDEIATEMAAAEKITKSVSGQWDRAYDKVKGPEKLINADGGIPDSEFEQTARDHGVPYAKVRSALRKKRAFEEGGFSSPLTKGENAAFAANAFDIRGVERVILDQKIPMDAFMAMSIPKDVSKSMQAYGRLVVAGLSGVPIFVVSQQELERLSADRGAFEQTKLPEGATIEGMVLSGTAENRSGYSLRVTAMVMAERNLTVADLMHEGFHAGVKMALAHAEHILNNYGADGVDNLENMLRQEEYEQIAQAMETLQNKIPPVLKIFQDAMGADDVQDHYLDDGEEYASQALAGFAMNKMMEGLNAVGIYESEDLEGYEMADRSFEVFIYDSVGMDINNVNSDARDDIKFAMDAFNTHYILSDELGGALDTLAQKAEIYGLGRELIGADVWDLKPDFDLKELPKNLMKNTLKDSFKRWFGR